MHVVSFQGIQKEDQVQKILVPPSDGGRVEIKEEYVISAP
jgi:hypothetical protein